MNIIYAANDGYARHLGASLYSLLEHNSSEKELMIYIMSVGMSDDNWDKLKKIAGQFKRQPVRIEVGDLQKRFTGVVDTRGFDISAMARLFAASELPESVERAIYLDCDTIVLDCLRPLWETALEGRLVGMVPEPTAYEEMRAAIDLTMDDPYFNSGVLLMDLAAWRREAIGVHLLEYYAKKGSNLFACDQDTLNGALKGRILALSPRYNFFTNYHYFRYRTLTGISAAYRAVSPYQFAAAKRRPAVVHYMGDERPWIAGNRNYYRRFYEKYLAATPWKGTPPETGKELYMIMYWLMNQITVFMPQLRMWISRRLGMKVIDARKSRKEQSGAVN